MCIRDRFFAAHSFDYKQVTQGMQRMLWGFFKILVISERMGLVADTVYGDYNNYPGFYIWIGTIAFAFQLYTNFSGGMDIALGLSQTFGIKLPENFERPFFSKNISEYWRRWHITLGIWMKEYIFYPILRSSFFTKLNKNMRKYVYKRQVIWNAFGKITKSIKFKWPLLFCSLMFCIYCSKMCIRDRYCRGDKQHL